MFFTVIQTGVPAQAEAETAYLIRDNWNDWFTYVTMFTLVVVDGEGERRHAGSVKIGQRGLAPLKDTNGQQVGLARPAVPDTFDELGPEFFSLGQDENYYETLNLLAPNLKRRILDGLRDVAQNLDLFAEIENEDVTQTSLMRSVSASRVRGRFHRLALGDAKLTEFHFSYELPGGGLDGVRPPVLTFDVHPEAQPPTNVHVLIGRNGVGKTRFMQGLARALLGRDEADGAVGNVLITNDGLEEWTFAGLVLISFSAFDDFDLIAREGDELTAVQVGLRTVMEAPDGPVVTTKAPEALIVDFASSLGKCRTGLRAARWRKAVETLEADDLFAEAEVTALLADDENWRATAGDVFRRLSSGHKIVLLTITRLVELTDERTLILLDEPEAHLHPPLLSAFVRSLSDLLVSRNGVAIIATHSPVVLQEVPRSCTWKLRRSGAETRADRPVIETFAENVSDLTREVFGLEITKSGFHRLIADAVAVPEFDYDAVLGRFEGQLGAEGRALARALVAERDTDDGL